MRKQEKEALVRTLKHWNTKKLNALTHKFDSWVDNHSQKKSSWWWSGDNGNASIRGWRRGQHTFEDSIAIGTVTITYWSDMSQSRRHTYWYDGFKLHGIDANISFGDISYLMDAIDVILDSRAKKAAKKNTSADEETAA